MQQPQPLPSQMTLMQRQQLYDQQQQQAQMRLHQFQQEQQRQQLAASMLARPQPQPPQQQQQLQSLQQSPPPQQLAQQPQQQQHFYSSAPAPAGTGDLTPQQQQHQYPASNNHTAFPKQNWDILTATGSTPTEANPMALALGPHGNLVPMVDSRWGAYDMGTIPNKMMDSLPRSVPEYNPQQQQQQHPQHPSMLMLQRQYHTQAQGHGQGQGQAPGPDTLPLASQSAQHHPSFNQDHSSYPDLQQQQQQQRQQDAFANEYLFDAPSPVPTMSSLDLGIVPPQQQQTTSPSPVHIPEYLQTSCSPDMPIKHSPVEGQLAWAPWEDAASPPEDHAVYATPARTHTSFDEGSRDDVDLSGTKHLKVFTSSKKDDDGEFRKGQQFYLNIQLSDQDRDRYRYLRIPAENIVLPCKADAMGRISLNASGKRSADSMSAPTSAQEEDVLALKLTTFLEPEHRPVVPCGRCKDKTPEILRFHPGVNGKPMIDENGMVTLRNGQVKMIASAWCASTSHHRGPGTKFSFQVELSSMSQHQHQSEPVIVYHGKSDEVEIYASHGRDKGSRKNAKPIKSQSPPAHDSTNHGQGHNLAPRGPPSPAKTSSPPGSPPTLASDSYDMGPIKKRREEPPLTPSPLDSELPPTIKSLEPRKGPICRENHVIIIGSNFTRGMTPMFGREYAKVVDINPFYIECTTPRYPRTETVRLWIHHNETFLPSDKTYEFTNEQAQSDLELMLRNMIQSDADAGDAGSYFSMLERIAGLPPSTDISGQSQSNGSTMLHNSVLLGYQAGVHLLIEEGIELDIEDDSGLTALDYAIHTNNVEITSALLYAGSMVSYERLDNLPLRPTTEMAALLKDVCGVDLPMREPHRADFQDQVPEIETQVMSSAMDMNVATVGASSESDNVPSGDSLISETILEEEEDLPRMEQRENDSTSQSRSTDQVNSSKPTRVFAIKPRPMSISTITTQSTGMSLAPTMSTISASSSTQSRPVHMGGRPAAHMVKGGQENIWQCAKKGSLSMVKYHLEKDPTLINTPWKFDGRSVLSSACASSQPHELVEYLVQRGAQVNSADSFHKRTALHALCEEGGLSQDDWRVVVSRADQEANEQDVLAAMRFLLDRGAVADAKNHWKETPLMKLVSGRDCPLMVQELYSRGADSRLKSSKDVYPHGTVLSYAAYFGRTQTLKWIIENDLLLNDESNIKDAIRWAKSSKGESSHGNQQVPVAHSLSMVRRKEERKAEAIRLLESWLGDSGVAKRKALAKDVVVQQADGWWRRMSGIVEDPRKIGDPSNDGADSHMPSEMRPLWREVQSMSESLASTPDHVSSPSSKTKWNPLKMLGKSSS